eukprot:CAMPEP_0202898164 /NCGR_PEP_ID=MMETSP1392-20130828/6754_1 /ASSEMBLY_ACC=CAM_ASM_000868 /TAXON_ID=225041 /ORGANISM="Chlamydomonas chlamydogama, Strain SAG 11-48b" /LENGTH=860 /DNA_ID=CAMNT_0049584015 /DNA_START=924 /DNA_END=3506 /DNA_ORIENTATION=-
MTVGMTSSGKQALTKKTEEPAKRISRTGTWRISLVYIAAAALMVLAAIYFKTRGPGHFKPPELTPLRAPKLTSLPELKDPQYEDKMLWGSYRSGLYFGMRTRTPKSLLSGLMWFNPDSVDTLRGQRVRHAASQDDELSTYGWVRHDGESYGRQVLVDGEYNMTLQMVKHFGEESGTGGDWAVRILVSRAVLTQAQIAKGTRPGSSKRVSLVMYLGDEEAPRTPWRVLPQGEPEDLKEGSMLVTGGNKAVGTWSFHTVQSASAGKKAGRLDYLALPDEPQYQYLLHIKELMMGIMYERLERNPSSDKFRLYLPNGATTGSNIGLFQVTVSMPATVDFVFLSHQKGVDPLLADPSSRVEELSGAKLTALLQRHEQQFDSRFDKSFLSSGPGAPALDEETQEVAKAALSNLLGSMGYFYGTSQVRLRPPSAGGSSVHNYWDAPLYSAVPSRSFFPRGFLWDEGFHQLLVQRWNARMSRDVIAHWLDLMNTHGWIPREQILGKEAAQRVPAEFVVQDPSHANPPSLFLPIMNMARQLQRAAASQDADLPEVQQFLRQAWPRLEAWYRWFNTTQAGPVPTSYRWHGRNSTTNLELNPKTLTSGLDDYPRASHPTDQERHLDLRCWMALASEAMAIIGEALGLPAHTTEPYRSTADTLRNIPLLASLHLDPGSGQYRDYGLHTEDVVLQRRNYNLEGKMQEMTVRVVGTPPTYQLVPCFGYVSLFPLLMRLLPPSSEELGRQLELLRDPQLLWTPFGIRSLSPTCSLYKKYNTAHDPPYWRGQIWININYLALTALDHYRSQEGPWAASAQQAYEELRTAVLSNVVAEYKGRGYLYEQYDDASGRGVSSHPFTGWTALVALMAAGK